jgi:Cellulase (glycosyl hydrolase family 5)
MRIRHTLLVVTMALTLVGLAAPAPAAASPDQYTVVDPTPSLLNGESPARRADILDRLQALGVDTVRIQVQWRFLAPSPESSTEPAGFDATDPSEYPPRAFDVLDSIVRGAKERGMDVLLTPTSPVPDWATSNQRGGLYSPRPADFERFVQALGERYSGSCVPPRCSPTAAADPLPRVDRWAVWNEPNLRTFLRPQRTAAGRTISGFLYRGLFLAAQRGLDLSGHKQDTLLLGDTSPSRGSASTAPLKFMRQVFCLSPAYKLQRPCSPIDASGWAHHPYNPHIPPWEKPKRTNRTIVSTGNINKLVRALKRVAQAGATTRRLPVYVTEYGIESYPQGGFGVSPQRQAEYLGIAEYLLWRNPWVKTFAQYLLDDDRNPRQTLSFQTGLRFASGFPKPAYDAFPITLVARRTRLGDVELWGHVRPGEGPYRVEVRFRDSDTGTGQLLSFQQTDRDGYFQLDTGSRPGREWQATCQLPNGAILQGPFIRSYRFD